MLVVNEFNGISNMIMANNKYLKNATKEANKSLLRFKVGAIIVSAGRIIASGFNERRFTRFLKDRRHIESLCAEQSAVLKLLTARRQDELVGSTLYVTRTNKHGIAMAKPCKACQDIIRSVGIRKVYYTDEQACVVEYRP